MTTYTNLGIKKIVTGEEAGTWGNSTNTNFDYFDQAIVGYSKITLSTAGSAGAPNLLEVLNYAPSSGRSRVIEFTSATDIGGNAYVQISPDDFEGYYFVRNSLLGARSIFFFQGTWDAGRDLELSPNADAVILCTGEGSISYVKNILAGLQTGGIVTGDITGSTITASTQFTGPGSGLTGTASGLTVGTSTNATNTTNVGITDDISSTGSFYPTYVTNTTGNLGVRTSSTKLTYQPSTGTFTSTVLSATTGNITNLNVSGDIAYFSGTGAVDITAGTTAQRPASPTGGMIRYNTTTGYYEVYTASGWVNLATGSGATGLGVGQNWTTYSVGSGQARQLEQTYTNTTSAPIAVMYSAYKTASLYNSAYITGVVNGTSVIQVAISDSTVGQWNGLENSVHFIVPPGQTYRVDTSVAIASTITTIWAELR